MNTCSFAGRIGRQAALRHTSAGKTVASFSLAVDEYAGHGERRTLWIDCSIWGERAEKLSLYLVKGAPVAVSGQVGVRTYESHGETKAALTLRVADVTLLGSKHDGERPAAQAAPTKAAKPAPQEDFDDEIPF